MIVWGLETGLIFPATEAAERIGRKVALKEFNKQFSGDFLKHINKTIGTTVVTKYGTRRGGVALGRIIPLGVGAGVGAAVNWLTARTFGVALIHYYDQIEPGTGLTEGRSSSQPSCAPGLQNR